MLAPPTRQSRLAVNGAIALGAVLVFHLVSIASGKLGEMRGLGWDGENYTRMVTGTLADGSMNTQTRPLLVLAVRVPHAFGLDIVSSFHLLNYLYAFVLYLAVALILQRYGASLAVRAGVTANVALCIATSKMFAFYPVQIDLGAIALVTVAFYLVTTDRRWLAAIACVLAAASREFGIAPAFFGIHRTLRRGRPWYEALAYAPGLLTIALVRWWVMASNVGDARDDGPLSIADAIQNLAFLASPGFVAGFAYFAITVFGGISVLLVLRPRWSLGRLREQPELATFLLLIVGMSVAGNLDIWRYLVFALPVAIVLIAQYCRGYDPGETGRFLLAMTLVTILTQRPFEAMDRLKYFRDWFPLYHYFEARPPIDGLIAVWAARMGALILAMVALSTTMGRSWRRAL